MHYYKSKYIKQILTDIKWEIYSNEVILGDFNTSYQWMHHKLVDEEIKELSRKYFEKKITNFLNAKHF